MPLNSTRGAGSAKGFGLTAGAGWDGSASYLVVAGGGGGATSNSGGAGAGGGAPDDVSKPPEAIRPVLSQQAAGLRRVVDVQSDQVTIGGLRGVALTWALRETSWRDVADALGAGLVKRRSLVFLGQSKELLTSQANADAGYKYLGTE